MGWCGANSGVAIPPSWRQKSLQYKRMGVSQAESNKATVCTLPSIHLPLTRETRVLAICYILRNWQSVHMASVMVPAIYVRSWWIVGIFVGEWACPSRWIDVCDFLSVFNLSSIKGKMQFLFTLVCFWIVYYNYNDVSGGTSKARMPIMNAQRLCKDAKPTERS